MLGKEAWRLSKTTVASIDESRSESLPLEAQELRGPALRRTLGLITVAWLFGSVWANSVAGTPFTSFAKSLNASKFQFGVLSALPFLASLLSLPASLLIEATGKRKKIFLWSLYFQRAMWFPIAVVPLWLVSHYGMQADGPAMILFLWLVFIMYAGNAIGGPAWVSWMADIVPERRRSKYFARRRQWGIVPAIPAALLAGYLLDHYGAGHGPLVMMRWCAIVFVGAAVCGLIDIHLFQYVPDIPTAPKKGQGMLGAWREPLRNRRFIWFAGFVATLTFAVSFMGQFVTLYILEQLGQDGKGGGGSAGVNRITQMMVIVAPGLAQLLLFSVWGKAADRMGKRPLLVLAGLGLVPVALGWCFVTRNNIWLGYVLSAAGAALWAGVEVANLNLVLEWSGSPDEENGGGGAGYMAINSVIINVAGCLGGLASGVIAQWLQNSNFRWETGLKTFTFYDVLFALSALLRLISVVVFLPHIHEPQAKPTREALLFMTANIYNNLFNAVLQPLRMMGFNKKETYVEAGARDRRE